jgi:NAD(P)-dependent dehydrogenase (short-subunit alcohol dehydrogenase family)
MKLAGCSVIVTGAVSGIGRATARLFAAEGAAVIPADLRDCAAEAAALEQSGARPCGGVPRGPRRRRPAAVLQRPRRLGARRRPDRCRAAARPEMAALSRVDDGPQETARRSGPHVSA